MTRKCYHASGVRQMTQIILPKTIMIDGKWVSDVLHVATRGAKGWSDRPVKKGEAK